MSEKKFIGGLIVKAPHENAPDYVIAKLSIKRLELIEWLKTESGEWINADIKESQNGKWYASVDDWKPERQGGNGQRQKERQAPAQQQSAPPMDDFADDDIPW